MTCQTTRNLWCSIQLVRALLHWRASRPVKNGSFSRLALLLFLLLPVRGASRLWRAMDRLSLRLTRVAVRLRVANRTTELRRQIN